MPSFSWEPSFSVDVEPMDGQHKKIFDYMAVIYSALADKAKHDEIDELLDKFDVFCKMHFFEEERLMDGMNYPSIAEHKRQHDLFVLNLDRFRARDLQHQIQKNAGDFERIKDWFVNHILSEDMRYSEFYINKHEKA